MNPLKIQNVLIPGKHDCLKLLHLFLLPLSHLQPGGSHSDRFFFKKYKKALWETYCQNQNAGTAFPAWAQTPGLNNSQEIMQKSEKNTWI